jgi:iron complex outermembrane receptor protein
LGASALAGFSAHAAMAQESAAPAVSVAAQPEDTIAEVVVTARRREERNQTVPISITALTSERLQQQNITTAQDLQSTVPSLVIGASGQPSRDTQTFTLRGQGATFQASPGVVVYLNEVPLPAPTSLNQQGGPGNYVDLEGVQVLAGSQGTLFGRNTTGGAVLLVPRKPSDDFSGYAQARLGNYSNREFEAAINIPIISDKLLVRAAGSYRDREGYTRDVVWNKDRDDIHYYSGRLGILFKPTDRLENYLMAYGAESRNNGTGLIHRTFNIPVLRAIGFCPDAACTPYSTIDLITSNLGPRKTAPDVDTLQRTKTWGVTNTTSYELNDSLTLRNIVSYQRFQSRWVADRDATPLQHSQDFGTVPNFPVILSDGVNTAGPFTYTNGQPFGLKDDIEGITAEPQLQGNVLAGKLAFTVGGFYYRQKPVGPQGGSAINFCPAVRTGACPTAKPEAISGVTDESKALYAQATLDLGAVTPSLDGLKLTAGYRYTWDHITGFALSADFGTGANVGKFICGTTGQAVAALEQCLVTGDLRSSAPTWTVGLDYKLGPALLYAKASRGYKAGGFVPTSVRPETRTFEPEFVTTYEGGFKSDFRIGNMPSRLNASYYYSDYKNVQKAAADFNAATGKTGAAIRSAEAWIEGVEIQAVIKPLPELELGGSYSHTAAKFKSYSYLAPAPTVGCNGLTVPRGQVVDVTCIPYPYIAPNIYNVYAALNVPLSGDLGNLSVYANYAYTSSRHTEGSILPHLQPGEELEGFGLVNLSVDWNNIANSGVDAGVYVTNATNELYRVSNSNLNQTLLHWVTMYGEPRMVGVRLRYRFGGQR